MSFQHFLPEQVGKRGLQFPGEGGEAHTKRAAASPALLMLDSVLLDTFQGGLKADSVKLYLGLFVDSDKA